VSAPTAAVVADQSPPPVTAGGRALTSPSITLAGALRLAKLRGRGAPVSVTCNVGCNVLVQLLLDPRDARRVRLAAHGRPVEVGRGRARLTRGGRTIVLVKLSRKAARRLRRGGLRATLRVTASDGAGHSARVTKRVKLKR
jgi:hypothetical protein